MATATLSKSNWRHRNEPYEIQITRLVNERFEIETLGPFENLTRALHQFNKLRRQITDNEAIELNACSLNKEIYL